MILYYIVLIDLLYLLALLSRGEFAVAIEMIIPTACTNNYYCVECAEITVAQY